jgi:amino acid adenylation domain-containing protein
MTSILSPILDGAAENPAGSLDSDASVFPVSFGQQRLWFLDRLEPDSAIYIIPCPVRLKGPLEITALKNALQAMVDRHESFRTIFRIVDSQPAQVILASASLDIPVTDLACFSEEERELKAARLIETDAQQPFDLSRDLLLRANLLRLAPAEHILLVTMHHIICDGWSMGIFFRDLAAFYQAFCRGEEPALPELPIQYADFAVWQREWLRGENLQKQIDYWKQQLAGAPPLLEFPADRQRPAIPSYRGSSLSFSIDKTVAESLQALGRKEGCTLFMLLFAAFQTLAARSTGQTDIVTGTPIANRNPPETENIIGCFINTIMLRTDCSGDPTFRELLHRVRSTALDGYANQDLPFEKLVEELRPPRLQSYSPLCQNLFTLQNTPLPQETLGDLQWKFLDVDNETAKFDISLTLTEKSSGIEGSLVFATDLYDSTTMERLIAHYKVLLEGIAEDPGRRISSLPLLCPAERRQLLAEWNHTQSQYEKNCCIHELIEMQTMRTPDAIAAQFENEFLTFAQLDQQAARLARVLQSLGVGPEVLVGICVERSLQMLVALLAILKAGGAYIPLDPHYPKDRLDFVLQDSKATVLLTQNSLLDDFPQINSPDFNAGNGPKIICLDSDVLSATPENSQRLNSLVTPENLAYVLYTSGSTGKPKGVQIPHRAVVNFLQSMQKNPGLSSTDKLLAITTLSFDIAGLELLLPLITGAQVVIAKTETAMDGKLLAGKIRQCGATVLQATPATWRLLLNAGWKGEPRLKILCGGEAWPEELARELLPRCNSLWNMYGPTETTIWSAVSRVQAKQTPLISTPIANTQLYILDAQLQPVPIGVAGELHIGGDGLARGYLNRPELTAEKFIPNPFQDTPGSRIYKTGDLVRYRNDGQIEFLGRLDHQVKIRGFRIELGEIQSLLAAHPAVREAVVIAREDTPGEKRLTAYVICEPEQTCRAETLREYLKQKLPEYMVPAAFVFLEKFPLTPNGKVDRKQLPQPEFNRPEAASIAPRDALEMQLTKLWEKLFNVEPVGIRDNFFDLGGHSLLAVRLFAEIEKITGKNLPMVTLFQAPTVELLAGILRQQGWKAPWSSLVPIKAGGSKPPFYCVHGVGGNILEYLDLAKYMDNDQPFYGLQAVGLDGKSPWLETVEEMAAHYVAEIKAFQPRGPYYLGGSSFGGLVAFEMAQQLQSKGDDVALLAFFDTHAPGFPKYLPTTSLWRAKLNWWKFRISLHAGNLQAARGKEKFAYIGNKTRKWCKGKIILFQRQRKNLRERIEQFFWPKGIVETRKAGIAAHERYTAKPYYGSATLFRATIQPDGIEDHRALGWAEFVRGRVDICDTPGHHGSIVRDPRAPILAGQLKESLRKAQAIAHPSKMGVSASSLERSKLTVGRSES